MNSSHGHIPAEPAAPVPQQSSIRDICELVIGYGLIVAVIWTPRPTQRWVLWAAVAWFAISIALSFPGWKELGCRLPGLARSSWIAAVAMLLGATAIAVAVDQHTLHSPQGLGGWAAAFGGYAAWSFVQQFLMQGYFLLRFLRLLPSPFTAALAASTIFAAAHLPNPVLAPATLLWGLAACLVFIRYRNVWPLGIAHAVFGITIAITIPAHIHHNMRVGLGYMRYRAPNASHLSQIDHNVSTDAWVSAEAPTRR